MPLPSEVRRCIGNDGCKTANAGSIGRTAASDEEIVEAAKTVGAHEFIMKLPGGYDYIIQEGSSNISIGQRQLISFARTLLMNPRLLILDEATSSVDTETEVLIREALRVLMRGRTTIAIAHRLSTILSADLILVIHKGRIVERGKHKELLQLGGLYAKLHGEQFEDEPSAVS